MLMSLRQLPAAVLLSALIGNYFSGLMPLFRLSPSAEERRIMNLMGGSGARWDPGTGRTDHFCAGRDGGQLIFDPLGSSQARGVTAALSLAPHLNLNSILWCSYAPTWQASGVICSAQNAEPFFLCALTEIWVIKVKWNALGKKNSLVPVAVLRVPSVNSQGCPSLSNPSYYFCPCDFGCRCTGSSAFFTSRLCKLKSGTSELVTVIWNKHLCWCCFSALSLALWARESGTQMCYVIH